MTRKQFIILAAFLGKPFFEASWDGVWEDACFWGVDLPDTSGQWKGRLGNFEGSLTCLKKGKGENLMYFIQ